MGKGVKIPEIYDVEDDDLLLKYVKTIRVKSLQKLTEDEDVLSNSSIARVVNEIASGLAQDVYKQKELRIKEEEVNATNENQAKILEAINALSQKRSEALKQKKNKPQDMPDEIKIDIPDTVKEINPQTPTLNSILEEFRDEE